MDIGRITNNYKYYEEFEGEPDIIIMLTDNPDINIHIWDGYFNDIYNTPTLDGKGWHGFTRDFQQMEGVFDTEKPTEITNVEEYLKDILQYKDKKFDFEETAEVLSLIVDLMQYAIDNSKTITVDIF